MLKHPTTLYLAVGLGAICGFIVYEPSDESGEPSLVRSALGFFIGALLVYFQAVLKALYRTYFDREMFEVTYKIDAENIHYQSKHQIWKASWPSVLQLVKTEEEIRIIALRMTFRLPNSLWMSGVEREKAWAILNKAFEQRKSQKPDVIPDLTIVGQGLLDAPNEGSESNIWPPAPKMNA